MELAIAIGWFALLIAGVYWFMVRPQRRAMEVHQGVIERLQVGDEIVSAGGIYGTIRALRDDVLEVEIADGVTISLARGAVARLATPDPEPGADPGTA